MSCSSSRDIDLDLVERLADSFVRQLREGRYPSASEYAAQFPELKHNLRDLLATLVELERQGNTGRRIECLEASKDVVALGDFRIIREIGRGGMGVVYEAIQESLGRQVALKVLASGFLSKSQLDRFHLEARAAAKLHHANIVPIFGIGEHAGKHFFSMQYIPGMSLDLVIEKLREDKETDNHFSASRLPEASEYTDQSHSDRRLGKQLPRNEPHQSSTNAIEISASKLFGFELQRSDRQAYYKHVARVGLQVAEALSYAHSQGIVHRDIKPSNLLMDPHGVVWITDFGLAKIEDSNGLTESGELVGTLRYMAPECIEGHSSPAGDIYALGASLYELLVLRPLHGAPSRAKLIETIANAAPIRLRKLDSRIPRDLETIVDKATAKDLRFRYHTAVELAEDLDRFLVGLPVLARPTSWLKRGWLWCQRQPALAATATALVFVLFLGFAGVTWKWRDAEQARQEAMRRADDLRIANERLMAAGKLVEQGMNFYALAYWDESESAYTRAIRVRPDLASAVENRGQLYFQLGLFDLAAEDFQRASNMQSPAFSRKWLRDCLLRLTHGDVAGYVQVRDQMLREIWGNSHVHIALDVLRASLVADLPPENMRSLIKLGIRCHEAQPSWASLYVLGLTEFRAGHYEEAIRRCQESLALGAQDRITSKNHAVLAMAFHRLNRPDEARGALESATQARDHWIEQMYTSGDRNWILLLGSTNNWPTDPVDWLEFELQYAEACRTLEVPLPAADGRLHAIRARAFAGLRSHGQKAVVEYQRALQLRPDDLQLQLEAHRNRGYYCAALGQFAQAAEEFQAAAQLALDEAVLTLFVAVAQLASGQDDAYRQTCQAMLERFGMSKDRRVLYLLTWTLSLGPRSLDNLSAVSPLAEEGANWWIDSPQVLVGFRYRIEDYDGALRAMDESVEICNPTPRAMLFAAMAHFQLGNRNEACRWLDRAEDALNVFPGGWDEVSAGQLIYREAVALIRRTPSAETGGRLSR